MDNNEIIRDATFNPKVKTYIFLIVLFYLIVSFIGIVIVPFWVFGLGQWLSNKFFLTLKCQLTEKQLKFSKGLVLHIEKTIPLENIQDLSFIGGPVLRWFGLTLIRVETAGGGGHRGTNMMSIPGINDAEEFKTLILNQREKVIKAKSQGYTAAPSTTSTGSDKILLDIKNELSEIKNILKSK
ncbi:MAG: PH domain-containing protein [Sphingobacteriaceae bacterium]|nr:PH domain-containing protein [Sphingobacteriaceae bacterium]